MLLILNCILSFSGGMLIGLGCKRGSTTLGFIGLLLVCISQIYNILQFLQMRG